MLYHVPVNLPDKPARAHFDIREIDNGFALDIKPTYQPLRFWKQPQGVGIFATTLSMLLIAVAVLGNISDHDTHIDLPAWLVFIAVFPLGTILGVLIMNIAHKVTMYATLEVTGQDENTSLTLTYQSRIRPKPRQMHWHASEIACISNLNQEVKERRAVRFNPLEITLFNDKRVKLLNQLPKRERDWIATVLRGITGLPAGFEVFENE